jgi:hypothetical protein
VFVLTLTQRHGSRTSAYHAEDATIAYRVDGAGGFAEQTGSFTLAPNVYHNLTIGADGYGRFTFTITDGSNSANSISGEWTNANSVGRTLSIRRAGALGAAVTDRFTLSTPGEFAIADACARACRSIAEHAPPDQGDVRSCTRQVGFRRG